MELFRIFGSIAVNNDEANRSIDETTDRAERSESKMSGAFKKIGAVVAAAFAVDKIKQFGADITNTAAEVSAEVSAFEQIMGDYSGTATEKMGEIADATGMVDTRLTPFMTSMTAKFKGLGFDIGDATDLASTGLTIAADAAAFWDKSLEDSMGSLNSFVNGSYEGGEAIGLFANETTLADWASKNLGLQWDTLTEKDKQFARLEFAKAMQESSGATGQAAKESDQYANVQANLTEKWRQFKAQIGEPLLQNIVLPAMQKLSEFVDKLTPKFEELKDWISENKEEIKNWATAIAIGTTAIVAYKTAMAISSIISAVTTALNGMTIAQYALNLAMSLNPVGAVIAAIAALVAGFIILWKRSDKFRNFWIGLWENIKKTAEPVIKFLIAYFKTAWENIKAIWSVVSAYFQTVWENIKSIFKVVKAVLSGDFSGAWEEIKKIFSRSGEYFKTIWNAIKRIFVNIDNFFGGAFSKALEAIKKPFVTAAVWFNDYVIQPVKNFFSGLTSAVSGFFSAAWNAIVSTWRGVATWFNNHVVQPIKNFFQPIVEFFATVFNIIWELAVGCWKTIVLIWQAATGWFNDHVIQPVKAAFTVFWNAIKNTAKACWDAIVAVWNAVSGWFNAHIITPVKTAFTAFWNTIKSLAAAAWNGIKTVWSAVSGWFDEHIISQVKTAFSSVWNTLKKGATDAWNGIKTVFSAVASFFKSTFENAWSKVKAVFSTGGKIFDGIKDGIVSSFKSIVNAIIRGINKVISVPFEGINKALDKIKNVSILGKKPFNGLISRVSVPSIPQLATGGVLEKGQIGLLEGSGAEAVVPLEKNRKWISEVADEFNGKPATPSERLYELIENIIGLLEKLTGMNIYLDSGTLVGELAPAMDTALGSMSRMRGRGN